MYTLNELRVGLRFDNMSALTESGPRVLVCSKPSTTDQVFLSTPLDTHESGSHNRTLFTPSTRAHKIQRHDPSHNKNQGTLTHIPPAPPSPPCLTTRMGEAHAFHFSIYPSQVPLTPQKSASRTNLPTSSPTYGPAYYRL